MSEIDQLLDQFDIEENALAKIRGQPEFIGVKSALDEAAIKLLPLLKPLMDGGLSVGAIAASGAAGELLGPAAPLAGVAIKLLGGELEGAILRAIAGKLGVCPTCGAEPPK